MWLTGMRFGDAPIKPESEDDHLEAMIGEPVAIDILENDQNDTDPSTVNLIPESIEEIEGVVGEDTDDDGDIDLIVVPGEGTWSVDENGTLTFTPEEGYIGDPMPIEYTVEDHIGNPSDPATVTLNYPPMANDDEIADVAEGALVTFVPQENDLNTSTPLDPTSISLVPPAEAIDIVYDAEGDVIGFMIPGEGTWQVDEETGVVTFDPDPLLEGDPRPIGYTIREINGDVSNEAMLIVSYIRVDYAASPSISGMVWRDGNGNGVLEEGEVAIDEPILVELLDADGQAIPCPYADRMAKIKGIAVETEERCIVETVNGEYSFDVLPGTYQVRFTMPEDMIRDEYAFSEVSDEQVLIQQDTFTYTTVVVAEGESIVDLDAPIMCPCALIEGDSADAFGFMSLMGLGWMLLLTGWYALFRDERSAVETKG